MAGIKHLIECHCMLRAFKNNEQDIYHKFTVYSQLDERGNVIEKTVSCNNCQSLHKVYDICKSNILPGGKDENKAQLQVEDIEIQLSEKICKVLKKYDVDLATWEQVLDIVECEEWGHSVVLSRELLDFKYNVKILQINSNDKIKILTKILEDEVNFKV